jgi:hypothetical protein
MLDAELYTRPRNMYMARIRNPHPLLVAQAQAEPAHGNPAAGGGGHP